MSDNVDRRNNIELKDLAEPSQRDHPPENHESRPILDMAWKITDSLFKNDCLERALERYHISAIAFSGTIGIGFFVTSGEMIAISGSAGCVIAFIWAGSIIIAVMMSLAEMVSVRPVSGALMDYPHIFVDPALGFAVGVTYWLAQCMSMATLTAAAARVADTFSDHPLSESQKAPIIVSLCFLTLLSNLCGVKLYANLERGVKWLKSALLIGVCVLMIAVISGLGVDRADRPSVGWNYTEYAIPQNFTWAGFNATSRTDSTPVAAIDGNWGRFLGILTSTIFALFACMGGDIAIVTAGEAKNPRKDLPGVAQFMYLVPIGFYVITSLLMGFNINYWNPDLFHTWAAAARNTQLSHSPIVIIIKYTSIKVLPGFLNACFLFAAYTAANTGLYSSSRTLFALAQTYGNDFVKETLGLGRTNDGHTPIISIICSSSFGLLALFGLKDESFNQPILTLSAFFTGSIACVYASECIAFLRFKRGLTIHKYNLGFSRDSDEYKRKHYRAYWQPFFAIYGLFSCIMIIILSGWPAAYLLKEGKDFIETNMLKSRPYLGADVGGAYSGPILFVTLYVFYKIIMGTSIQHFENFKDAYFMPEFDGEDETDDEEIEAVPEEVNENKSRWKDVLKEVWSYVK